MPTKEPRSGRRQWLWFFAMWAAGVLLAGLLLWPLRLVLDRLMG